MALLTKQEQKEVTLLCFAETMLVAIANSQKPKSRRHNQLVAAIEKIKKVD